MGIFLLIGPYNILCLQFVAIVVALVVLVVLVVFVALVARRTTGWLL